MSETKKLHPMSITETLLIFVFTTVLGLAAFYWFRPWLEVNGVSPMKSYLLSISAAFLVMLVWSLAALKQEQGSLSWETLSLRFRLNKLNSRMILWAVGLSVVMLGSELLFSPVLSVLIGNGVIQIPDSIPDYLNPEVQLSLGSIKAQWLDEGVFWILPFVLLLNIIGEEFLWRGYLLPRQELTHGRYTWVLHGFLWGFSHAFQFWLLPPILVGTLALSYVIQRQKNTWVAILAHAINNSLPMIVLAFA